MEDAMVKNRTSLAPENLKQLQFIKGTNDYVYAGSRNGTDAWLGGNMNSSTDNIWLSLTEL